MPGTLPWRSASEVWPGAGAGQVPLATRSGGGENTAKALPESQTNVVGFALALSAKLGATNDLFHALRSLIHSSGR